MKNKSEATKSGKPLVTRLSIYDEPHFSIKQFEKRGSFIMVPVVGLEPTPCCQERILSPSRLPFHHTGLLKKHSYYSVLFQKKQAYFIKNFPKNWKVRKRYKKELPKRWGMWYNYKLEKYRLAKKLDPNRWGGNAR